MKNLNELKIKTDTNIDTDLSDFSIQTQNGTAVYFKDIKKHLIKHISQADAVFGAVAWLTDADILNELSKLKNVSIIVQKEDFLRPDIDAVENWKQKLRKNYEKLRFNIERHTFNNILGSMSSASDPTISPIRCVGNHNSEKKPAFPRMHNKFLVFAKIIDSSQEYETKTIKPYGVWSGSFNLTQNANNSFENALYLADPDIVNAYFNEYAQIMAISEPLDWETEWVEPEWRIGT